MNTPITIYQTFDTFEAELIKSLFDSEGIFCFLKTNDACGALPHLRLSQGGIEIVINKEDLEAGKKILAQNVNLYLEHYDTIPKEYEEVLYEGISVEAFLEKGLSPMRPFSIFIKDQKGNVLGGASGTLFYGSLYVDSLWIDKTLRSQGWGTKLMLEAEKVGMKHGALFATLNTMDWEALPFYQKLGYSIEFTREGYEKESKMFMLRKNLSV